MMVYKKYTYKNGKKFGPYYYETKRVDGKIVTKYLGTTIHKKNSKLLYGSLTLLFLILIFIAVYFLSFTITGNVSLDMKTNYKFGEDINGKLNLNLFEGELLPADSVVLVSYGNFSKEFILSDLISEDLVEGKFYAEGVSLSGNGEGYGVLGKIIEYHVIDFKLNIFDVDESSDLESDSETVSDEQSSPDIDEENENQESDDSESVSDELNTNNDEESQNQESENTESDSSESSETSGESSVITGSVISDSKIIGGRVSKDNPFTYSISDGEMASLVEGSVYHGDFLLEDDFVGVKIKSNEVTVSTDYFVEKEGFGEEYIGKIGKKILIDTGDFELVADSESAFIVSINYDGQKIVEASDEITIVDKKSDGDVVDDEFVSETEINDSLINKTIIPENITEINQTELTNVTELNKTLINESLISVDIVQFTAVIGQPVRWVKKVSFEDINESLSLIVEIPASAGNVTIEKIKSGKKDEPIISDDEDVIVSNANASVEEAEENTAFSDINVTDSTISENPSPDLIIGITGDVTAEIQLGDETIFSKILKFFRFTGRAVDSPEEFDVLEVLVEVDSTDTGVEIEYYTDAPTSSEEVLSNGLKRIYVSSPEDVNYENVLIFTNLSDNLKITDSSSIRIEWVENDTLLEVYSIDDLNDDGYYDYVEWIAPHLSNQTFNIIVIIDALHLDENRTFISNIYNETRDLDGVWSETILDRHYVRVRFERNLTSDRDITIYPRIVSGNPMIEVYEVDGNEIIASFDEIVDNEYNKVYLNGLIGEQDTFDLKIIGGSVEFDHIIDPPTQVFFDSFEDAASWTYWTEVVGTGWDNVNACPTGCAHGSQCACAESGARDALQMSSAIDLTSYQDCILDYSVWIDSSFDNGEFYYVNVTDSGGTFINIFSCTNGQACENNTWNPQNYNITSGVGLNNNFNIRVTAALNDVNEEAGFDLINVTCITTTDTTPPEVTINQPLNASLIAPILFNVTTNENSSFANYTLTNGVVNYTMQNSSNRDFNATNDSIVSGQYTVKYFVWDANGNLNSTENRTFSVLDTTFPIINFTSPTPANGPTQSGDSIFVNVSASDMKNISSFIDFDNSLVSWWRMDDLNESGGVVDYLGMRNGTAYGNAVQNDSGKMGKSFSFDGSGDYLRDFSTIELSNRSYTISGWIYPVNTGVDQIWFTALSGNFNNGNLHLRVNSAGTLIFGLWFDDLSGGTVNFGDWNFVTYTYDNSTDTSKIYINSTEVASGNNGPFNGNSPTINIGMWDYYH